MRKYGIDWDERLNDVDIELACYASHWSYENLTEADFFKNAAKELFKEPHYIWNHWSDVRLGSWCNEGVRQAHCDYITWWGAGSTGKSTDAALCVLLDWLAAPDQTRTVVCSTTRSMLDQRIFGEIVRLYLSVPGLPGEYVPSDQTIYFDKKKDKRNAIIGIAIQNASTIQEAVGNIIGAHRPRNRLVLDEMPHIKEAAEEARVNMASSGEMKFLGMGNPVDRNDLLCRNSEPIDGWNQLNDQMEKWETKKGMCYYFDGLKSPALKDPKKYHFLLSEDKIKETIKDYGEDSIQYWSQRRGFLNTQQQFDVVINESEFGMFKARENNIRWAYQPISVAGLDLSFAIGGDRCIFITGKVGLDLISENIIIQCGETHHIKFDVTNKLPTTYQVANRVKELCAAYRIDPKYLGVDITGTQRSPADVIETAIGGKVLRVDFASKATEDPVTLLDKTPCDEVYSNLVTQLWMSAAEYIRHGQLRSMKNDVIKELCARKLKSIWKPVTIEDKKEMKKRTNESPDKADAFVIMLHVVRTLLHILPGKGVQGVPKSGFNRANLIKKDFKPNYANQQRPYGNYAQATQ